MKRLILFTLAPLPALLGLGLMFALLSLPASVAAQPVQPEYFPFWTEDFSASLPPTQYYISSTLGSGVVDSGSFLLTQDAMSQFGRIFYLSSAYMDEFTADFRIFLGSHDGADGLAFHFCPVYDYTPNNGSTLDATCPGGTFVAFDTYPNVDTVYVAQGSYLNILRSVTVSELENNAWHNVTVNLEFGVITVILDSITRIDHFTIPGYTPYQGYFGFSAATGAAFNSHRVDDVLVQIAAQNVFLAPSSATAYGVAGTTVTYTETLINSTGVADSFDLTASGNSWNTTLSINNTGVISFGAAVAFTVQVEIPAGAVPGDSDTAIIRATSVTSPTVYSDTATLTTNAAGLYLSCMDALMSGEAVGDGVYLINPDGPGGQEPVPIYCDMTTDGGGWTLVGSTKDTTFNDQASAYYGDLSTLSPVSGHAGIWDGMRPMAWSEYSDLRFSCGNQAYTDTFNVDLVYYDIPWYQEITASPNDGDVCFEEEDGNGQTLPPPARQNLLTSVTLPLGDQWNYGYLEGEDYCGDTDDFTVDFDDRGKDGNQSDGTDWGEDDSTRKCGQNNVPGGAWFVWVREPVDVFLDPSSAQNAGLPGATVVYTETLQNLTGEVDTFDLTMSGNAWPTTLSSEDTGPVPNGASVTFNVYVTIPTGANPGESDEVIVQATSVLYPAVFFDTANLETVVLSGQYGYIFNADNNQINLVDTDVHLYPGTSIDTSPYGYWPWAGELSPDGQRLYTSLRDSAAVLVVDTTTNTPISSIPVGTLPFEIAFSPGGEYAFVANWDSDSISVIDTTALTVTRTIPVGDGPQGVATSPCLDKVYVIDRWDYDIYVLDATSMTVTHVISGFTDELFDIVISPYGHRAYVTNQWEGTIYVIDTLSDTWIDTWYIGASSQNGLDISPDGSVLYMTSNSDGILYVLDAFTGQILNMIITGPGNWQRSGWDVETFPEGKGNFSYVSLPGSGQVSVINTATHEMVNMIDTGGGPRGMALFPPETACLSGVLLDPPHEVQSGWSGASVVYTQTLHNLTGEEDSFALSGSAPAWGVSLSLANTGHVPSGGSVTFTVQVDVPVGAQIADYDIATITAVSDTDSNISAQSQLKTAVPRPGYVFNSDYDRINVVDTSAHVNTGVSIDTSPYGSWPWAGELSPDGQRLYTSLRDSNAVLVVDTATNTPISSIPVGNTPFEIAFSQGGAYAFVANWDNDSVSVIDTAALTITETIPVGDGPQGVASSPCLDKVYVIDRWDFDVYVLDATSLTVTHVITGFTDQLFDIVISPLGDRAYVTNQWEFMIYVIDTSSDTWIDTFVVPATETIENIDISPNGNILYVTDNGGGRTYALDAHTGDVIAEFGTGPSFWNQGSWGIEVFPWGAGTYAYVSSPEFWEDPLGDVKVLDLATNQVVGSIYLGGGPRGMALFPPASTCGALPAVDFVPATSTIPVGESVAFTSTASGIPAPDLTWDFGDGSPPSAEPNPVHPYLTEGVFAVTLLAENIFGQVSATGVVTVYVPVTADFSPLEATAVINQPVAFTNLSTGTGPLNYTWDFGDGSTVSSEINPVHAYSQQGNYVVTLTAVGPYGTDQVEGVIHVNIVIYLPLELRSPAP